MTDNVIYNITSWRSYTDTYQIKNYPKRKRGDITEASLMRLNKLINKSCRTEHLKGKAWFGFAYYFE